MAIGIDYIFDGADWKPIGRGGGAGSGGSSTFVGLTDTPSAFTGQAGKVATVNTGETALEFTAASATSFDTDFSVLQSTTKSIATTTTTKIDTFDTVVIDTNTEWDAVNLYWVCKTAGTYIVSAAYALNGGSTGYRAIYVYVDGVDIQNRSISPGASASPSIVCKTALTVGQYVEIYGRHSQGSDLVTLIGVPAYRWDIWRIK